MPKVSSAKILHLDKHFSKANAKSIYKAKKASKWFDLSQVFSISFMWLDVVARYSMIIIHVKNDILARFFMG